MVFIAAKTFGLVQTVLMRASGEYADAPKWWLTGNGSDAFVWNARNQLTAVKQGSTTIASFSYDPLGRRVGTDFNGSVTSYLYDGLNAVQETHGTTATSILTGLAVDERFARTDLSGRTDFLSDALNSTIALTNSAGAIVEQYSYDPYRNTTASVSGFDNPYQYTGRENDDDGLYYYRARYSPNNVESAARTSLIHRRSCCLGAPRAP